MPVTSTRLRALMLACALSLSVFVAGAASAEQADVQDTAVTIYSSAQPGAISPDLYRPAFGRATMHGSAIPGFAIVRQERKSVLRSGRSTLRFADVAGLIDPTTVRFSSLTDPDNTRVLEQSFQFDLVGTTKLMSKYVDKTITVDRVVGDKAISLTGILLSISDGLVLRDERGQIHAIRGYSAVRFPELPGGLITRPTLVWEVLAREAGEHQTRVSYETAGMTWWADYNLVFSEGRDANTGLLDVGAWVSIINQSGATYPDARLKLIAGDVHRAQAALPAARARRAAEVASAAGTAGFAQKAFFEFHLYTLGRQTTIPDNSTKQIELFEQTRGIPARKILVYYGLQPVYWTMPSPATDRDYGVQMNKKIDVYLQFENDERHGLGIPLPAGRIRVSKLDEADDTLEFIGEDVIDHTPKDEEVLVKLGSAFDVVGERKQIDFSIDHKARWLEEEIEIKLRNHKEEAVEVIVKENLYRWVNWKIEQATHPYHKEDARTIHFPVSVAPDGEEVVRYRVRYTW